MLQQPPTPPNSKNGQGFRDRRRCPRLPVPGLFVAGELSRARRWRVPGAESDTRADRHRTGAAIDLSGDGLSLTLPEGVAIGEEVLLTFRLADEAVFARVPAQVVRRESGFGVGAVRFHDWSDCDRVALLDFLVTH